MWTQAAAVILVAVQGLLPPGTSLPEPDEQTHQITFTRDGAIRYGAVRDLGEAVEIVYDTPWRPQPAERVLRSRIEFVPESRHRRQSRLEEQAREAGYTTVETVNGLEYRRIEDVNYAARAQAMAEAAAAAETAGDAETPLAAAAAAETNQPRAPWQRRAAQAAVLVAGFAAAAAALRFLVFQD